MLQDNYVPLNFSTYIIYMYESDTQQTGGSMIASIIVIVLLALFILFILYIWLFGSSIVQTPQVAGGIFKSVKKMVKGG